MKKPQIDSATWALASLPETLPRKVSTQIILSTLDDILHNLGETLSNNTSIFKRYILQVFLQYAVDNRRRMSSLDKEDFSLLMLKYFLTNDYTYLYEAKIDRTILFVVTDNTLKKLKKINYYEKNLLKGINIQEYLKRRRNLAQYLGAQEHTLFPLYNWINSYNKIYNVYRVMILSKYVKLAYHESTSTAYNSKLHFDRDDLYKNLIMSIQSAVDKCDQSKGTLTSYVQTWFISGKNHPTFNHQYGVSFNLPSVVKKQYEQQGKPLNDFIGTMPSEETLIDHNELAIDEKLRSSDIAPNLLKSMRYAKKASIATLVLNLPIILTQAEIANLKGSLALQSGKPIKPTTLPTHKQKRVKDIK